MPRSSDGFLTPDEVVKRWRKTVTADTLANWRSTNQGPPFVKIGGRVLYSIVALEEWERTRTKQPR